MLHKVVLLVCFFKMIILAVTLFHSLSFSLPPAPVLDFEPQDVPNDPPQPKTPQCSPPVEAPPTPACTTESQHDVPYFRAEIAGETNRLTSLCVHWEAKVEDESIPEESELAFTPVCISSLWLKGHSLTETCLFSERPDAYSSGPSKAVDEGALQAVQWTCG